MLGVLRGRFRNIWLEWSVSAIRSECLGGLLAKSEMFGYSASCGGVKENTSISAVNVAGIAGDHIMGG